MTDAYTLVKLLHILSSTILFGTGIGTAFQMLMATRDGRPEVVARVADQVVRADWWFTTPAVIVQPISGLALVHLAGYSLGETWLLASLALYAVAGAAWLPVVVIQRRLRDLAAASAQAGAPLSPAWHRLFRWWFLLGWPGFGAVIGIFALMVIRPG
ncbi:DUF2269 family protein [Zavarzinia aquatilis]|uniref:DUF2269 domain-containing protein n=1 Tax=Zavarzinia aquatilis TaxID=2211142 RepID=A0A317DZU4_9PROT|nr:DUF2269 domain-containing protein [Zavarzinia aquatilis]PWR18603.1 DUF2269 domain-containing protein [Zavarzinia aquatilis]